MGKATPNYSFTCRGCGNESQRYAWPGHELPAFCSRRCHLSGQAKDIAGHIFGDMLVMSRAGTKSGKAMWLCWCTCGRESVMSGDNLRTRKDVSCGCKKSQKIGRTKTTHGQRRTPEYATWCNMVARCHNDKVACFPYYGGRGIRVCDEWRGPGGFEKFIAHIGHKPSPEHSVDRIDVNGNYEPGNVRWATDYEQRTNTRKSQKWLAMGSPQELNRIAESLGITPASLRQRVRRGWSAEDALALPSSTRRGA